MNEKESAVTLEAVGFPSTCLLIFLPSPLICLSSPPPPPTPTHPVCSPSPVRLSCLLPSVSEFHLGRSPGLKSPRGEHFIICSQSVTTNTILHTQVSLSICLHSGCISARPSPGPQPLFSDVAGREKPIAWESARPAFLPH